LRALTAIALERGASFALVRQLAERQVDGPLLALLHHLELDVAPRRHATDRARQLTRVADRRAVYRRDDVAGDDACLRGRAVRLRLGDQRTLRLLHAEAFGD